MGVYSVVMSLITVLCCVCVLIQRYSGCVECVDTIKVYEFSRERHTHFECECESFLYDERETISATGRVVNTCSVMSVCDITHQ